MPTLFFTSENKPERGKPSHLSKHHPQSSRHHSFRKRTCAPLGGQVPFLNGFNRPRDSFISVESRLRFSRNFQDK